MLTSQGEFSDVHLTRRPAWRVRVQSVGQSVGLFQPRVWDKFYVTIYRRSHIFLEPEMLYDFRHDRSFPGFECKAK